MGEQLAQGGGVVGIDEDGLAVRVRQPFLNFEVGEFRDELGDWDRRAANLPCS